SVLRRRAVAGRHPVLPDPAPPSAEETALGAVQLSAVRAALRALPARQREVLVLRYYAGLTETQIAAALGISRGSVKSHAAPPRGGDRPRRGQDPPRPPQRRPPGSAPAHAATPRTAPPTTISPRRRRTRRPRTAQTTDAPRPHSRRRRTGPSHRA